MGRWFHNVHVRTEDEAPIARAISLYLEAQGFEAVKRDADADRTVRVSKPRKGWISIVDDGYGAAELARVVTEGSDRSAVEVYCEASAIVWLALHRGGRLAGGWGREIEEPPSEEELTNAIAEGTIMREPSRDAVDALGVPGLDADALSAKWRDAVRKVFPETAIAVAAKALGLDVARVFEDRGFRGTVLRVRRTMSTWTPTFESGPPCADISAYPPDALFVGRAFDFQISVNSRGGPFEGVALRLAWRDPAERDLLSLEKVVLRDGREIPIDEHGIAHVDAAVGAALTEAPDLGQLTRREMDRAHELESAATLYLTITGRTLREGRGSLEIAARPAGSDEEAKSAAELEVFFRPYRPLRTEPCWDTPEHDRRFFALHIWSVRFATISFSSGLTEAWAFARRWFESLGGTVWGLAEGSRVVAHARDHVLARLDALARAPAPWPWIRLAAPHLNAFGNLEVEPSRVYDGEEPVFVLSMTDDPTDDEARERLTSLCDEAMRSGVALSAVMGMWERAPRLDATLWEDLTLPFNEATLFRSWHAERLRAVDHEGVWLGRTHLARVSLEALPPYAEVTPIEDARGERVGARIRIPRELGRSKLRAIEEVLDPIMPSSDAVAAWNAAHPGRWPERA